MNNSPSAIARAIRDTHLPLSFAQERLWFLHQFEPESPLYNISKAIRLSGALNLEALQKTLDAIIERHEILRTNITTVNGSPVQVIAKGRSIDLALTTLRDCSDATCETEMLRILNSEARRPFDLSSDSVLRASLLSLREDDHVLLLVMHHIAADGWSLGILFRELTALYKAFSENRPSPLPDLPLQYADFALWQRESLQGEALERQLSYWRDQLRGIPALTLPTDRPRPTVQSFRGARKSLVLPKELLHELKALSRKHGCTLFMTLLAAFKVLLHRYTAQEDIAVGSVIANRNRSEIEELIGFFVNTLVLRTDLAGNPTFKELMARVRKIALDAYEHQDLPFEKLVHELHPDRNLGLSPLFQVMFILQNAPRSALELPALTVESVSLDAETAKFDLTCSATEASDALTVSLQYNVDLFDAVTIARMLDHFQTLLKSIVATPDQRVSELRMLTTAEKEQLLVDWNSTWSDYAADKCVHELFEEQVERSPDAVAVVFENQQLTYQELNRRANRLAHYLRTLGVGPDIRVAICMERSVEMVVGLIAILKAGGAYVPLDVTYPEERLAFMLQDSQASLLLTQRHLASALPNHNGPAVYVDDIPDLPQDEANPQNRLTPDNLAYVIYTSGSTGAPKGVMVEHRSVVNYLCWFNSGPLGKKRLPAITEVTFDLSLKQLLPPLLVGNEVWLIPRSVVSEPKTFVQTLSSRGTVDLNCVPSLWRVILQSIDCGSIALPSDLVASVMVGGEALSRQLLDRTFALLPEIEFWNLYGPTEATVNATFARMGREGKCPIGRPLANVQVYILDRYFNAVPVGVTGELYIGGAGLARGYLNRPELTAEQFVPNRYSEKPGARLYKTGDLARYLPDGNIEFLGRIDQQVKIRGFRVELGEIEAVLEQQPGVEHAVVLFREDEPDDHRLVAYVVQTPEHATSVGALKGMLQKKLPEYMIPSAFVLLDSLPLTTNGKVDRKALPAPDHSRSEFEPGYIAPRTSAEKRLAELWSQILKVEKIGIHDNFFELGGHSLLAIQAVSRARQAFDVDLPLRALFENPTVASLTVQIIHLQGEKGSAGDMAEVLTDLESLSDEEANRLLVSGGTKI